MNKAKIIKKLEAFVRKKMLVEDTGHDWWHVDRVRKMAVRIAKSEKKGDLFVIELAALTHDLDDWKFKGKNSVDVRKLLLGYKIPKDIIDRVLEITENISFKYGTNPYRFKTWDGKIVQDADRLDAIGAIGIARVFAFGGKMGRQIHEPGRKLKKYKSVSKIKWSDNTSVHHFYEKLLLLKDQVHTKTAKGIALRRHKLMEQYLKEFYNEWNGR